MLAKCVLASPAAGHRLRWREILKLVKSRLQRWSDGDLGALWVEALKGGQYSKAIKALTSDGLAAPTPEIVQEMLAKHPQAALPTLPPGPAPPPPLRSSRE